MPRNPHPPPTKKSSTSSDTWGNVTTNRINIDPPSTKSTVPGVDPKKLGTYKRPQPPKRASVGARTTKPLPVSNLRPLQVNNKEQDRGYINTKDNGPTVSVKATKAKLNKSGATHNGVSNLIQSDVDSPSRSSSVTSIKPVLPGIKQKSSNLSETVEQIPNDVEKPSATPVESKAEEQHVTTRQSQRPLTSRKRDVDAALNKKANELKQPDESIDYYMPDWYRNPLVKPEQLKGGVTVLCCRDEEPSIPGLEVINIINIQRLFYLKDTKRFMMEQMDKSLITIAYFNSTEGDKQTPCLPLSSVSKELAIKANSLLKSEVYRQSVHDADVYHYSPSSLDIQEMAESLNGHIEFAGYCQEIADSLGIKSATTIEQLQSMIVKAQKRRVNILKQERAVHSNIYLETFESDDIWNHVYTCHSISEDCFKREDVLSQLKSTIRSAVDSNSSPVIISGGEKTGKTWLCAQLPTTMADEALTLVRFCGLTSLTSSLPKLLYGLSKQLSAIYHTPLLSSDVSQLSIADSFKLFKDLLDEVSKATTKPVVLVWDGFDKLAASYVDLSHFISLFNNSVPNNVVLVVSLTSTSGQSAFSSTASVLSLDELVKEFEKEVILPEISIYSGKLAMNNADMKDLFRSIIGCASAIGLDASLIESALAKEQQLLDKMNEENLSFDFFAIATELGELQSSVLSNISAANLESSSGVDEDTLKEIAVLQTAWKDLVEIRDRAKTQIKAEMETLAELNPADTKYLDTMEQGLESTESDKYRIRLCDLSADEGRMFVRHLCQGKVEDSEAEVLEEIADQIHNPLLLRLLVNRCSLYMPAESIVGLLGKVHLDTSEWSLKKLNEENDAAWTEHSLHHFIVAYLIFNTDLILWDKDTSYESSPPTEIQAGFSDLSPLLLTDAARNDAVKHILDSQSNASNLSVDDIYAFLYYHNQLMDKCQLQVFEQGDYIRDVEQVESLIRSDKVMPNNLQEMPSLAGGIADTKNAVFCVAQRLAQFYLKLADARFEDPHEVPSEMVNLFEKFEARALQLKGSDAFAAIFQHLWQGISQQSLQSTHEADTWREVSFLSDDERVKDTFEDSQREKAPVTSAKDKNLMVGRDKLTAIRLCEQISLVHAELMNKSIDTHCDEMTSLHTVVEFILQYDILVPLLQENGVDYVIDSYGHILELVTHGLELQKIQLQNLLPLEMLYNLLTTYTSQLRDNVASFHTLFLSMFNDDSSLSSRAALRLYRRVMHEVDLKNNLHLVTTLPKTGDSSLLSADAKRYLHNTSNKYAASQCISNKSYILSHNKNNLVKLWELTGEFISAQRLDGRIVCVCPQTTDGCFLALIETVSEVGQKFASVWRIDRLTCKKLADVGSRTILSAWFDKLGEKLVMVEQCTVDEMRVVVCVPQTMEVKVEENAINILPYQPSNFMDKSLAIPHKVDETLLEVMKVQLAGDKPDADPTELNFFTSLRDGGAELKPIAVKQPLIFSSLQALWDDVLDKYDAKDDLVYPMQEIRSENLECREHLSKMAVTLHGMTSAGDIVVDTQYSDGTHNVLLYKIDGSDIKLNGQLSMDEQATMTLMPTDDFVYSDTGSNSGLISWHLPTNNKKIFGNEQKVHVTCLQYEVEEGQILSFTRGQVTVWNAMKKTTESSFTLDKASDKSNKSCEIVAASLQDNWLAIANREGELSIRFEIRRKMATYHFHEPVDWIDCHVVKDHLYVACHVNGVKPSICFLKYRVSDAPLHEPGKYVVRPEKNVPA